MSDSPEYDKTVQAEGVDPQAKNFERVVEEAGYSEEMETKEQSPESPETVETKVEEQEATPRVLTAWDTCDGCGPSVVALVLCERGEQEILLCTHHGRKSQPKMEAEGWTLTFTQGPS